MADLPKNSSGDGSQIRVLVVDDSAFMRSAISRLINSDPMLKVIDTARDGKEAVEKAKALKPDVITLDVEMPNVDGMQALRIIRREMTPPPAVLMCSSLTSAGSHAALQAMRLGAADVIAKDQSQVSSKMDSMRDELISKIKAIVGGAARFAQEASRKSDVVGRGIGKPDVGGIVGAGGDKAVGGGFRFGPGHTFVPGDVDLLLIGSSTGGPPVLEQLLDCLPADLQCPVVVAQHMPVLFTRSLAQRLDAECAVSVVHAEPEMQLHPGTVYICPGGMHTSISTVMSKTIVQMSEEPRSELYRPSVNVLFASAAKTHYRKIMGVVLTGMGDDGGRGAATLKAAKPQTVFWAQEASTCVVYGMPRAIVAGGLADGVGSPEQLATTLRSLGPGRKFSVGGKAVA